VRAGPCIRTCRSTLQLCKPPEQCMLPRTHSQLHNLRKFVPHNSRLRPAYFIAVDHSQQRIIWGARGGEALLAACWSAGNTHATHACCALNIPPPSAHKHRMHTHQQPSEAPRTLATC
jgi:hypothetical protein